MSTKRFSGKVALITGSSKGIGFAMAQRLGEEGAIILVCSYESDKNDEAVEKLKTLGIEASCVFCDVAKRDDNINIVKTTAPYYPVPTMIHCYQCIERYGRLDILIPCAGILKYVGNFLQTPEEEYDKHMDVLVKSAFWLAQEAEPYLEKTKGTIILVSSIGAYNPTKSLGIYCIAKASILAMVKVLALELADKGIRVNGIAPGCVDTDLTREFFAAMAKLQNHAEGKEVVLASDIRQISIDRHALKRFGKPSEISGAVAFLVSDDASYMTGETMVVGGGYPTRL